MSNDRQNGQTGWKTDGAACRDTRGTRSVMGWRYVLGTDAETVRQLTEHGLYGLLDHRSVQHTERHPVLWFLVGLMAALGIGITTALVHALTR